MFVCFLQLLEYIKQQHVFFCFVCKYQLYHGRVAWIFHDKVDDLTLNLPAFYLQHWSKPGPPSNHTNLLVGVGDVNVSSFGL